MVERIEYVNPKLHLQPLSDRRSLGQAEVQVRIIRSHESVTAKVAKVFGARNAVSTAIQGAGYLQGAEVEQLAWPAGAGQWVSNYIGTTEELAAAVEVALKQIIYVVGLS